MHAGFFKRKEILQRNFVSRFFFLKIVPALGYDLKRATVLNSKTSLNFFFLI